jgi:hypothetical protein
MDREAKSLIFQNNSVFLPIVVKTPSSFYVDSANGSDNNPGTSPEQPWQSLAKVEATRYAPGSIIHFKRGSTWTGRLLINDSGVQGNPITFTAYGSGLPPILTNPGDSINRTRGFLVDADWVVIEDFKIQDVFMAGVQIGKGSDHNLIRSVEVTQTGFGIVFEGQYNLVTQSFIHDLHMVNNTPGGYDDYGAVGVSIENSFNEVSYNRIINCLATSYDFGTDGGAVEWWSVADGVLVHNNWAFGNDGFLEVGGGSARNAVVAYNVSINNHRFAAFNLDGANGSVIENFRIDNNTIVEIASEDRGWDVFWFSIEPTVDSVILRNNLLYVDWFSTVANHSGFTHNNNLYYLLNGTVLNFDLSNGEILANPNFIDLANQNLHLQESSEAIDAGLLLNYSSDFEDTTVPVGLAPDLGAFEYQGDP